MIEARTPKLLRCDAAAAWELGEHGRVESLVNPLMFLQMHLKRIHDYTSRARTSGSPPARSSGCQRPDRRIRLVERYR